jgi:competence ComEA-like helix-hairpin-helix protein
MKRGRRGKPRRGAVGWPLAAGALLAAALLWTGWNLRWSGEAHRAVLAVPVAVARQEDSMPSPWEGRLGTGKNPIPVNTADEAELCRLYGIGPALAQAIIAQRETYGPFFFPEDLLSVKGITLRKLEKIIAEITLDP